MKNLVRAAVSRIVRWAVVESDGADAGPVPWQQVRYLDQSGRSTAWYPYGFSAVAPDGSLSVVLQFSGHADSRVHFPGSPKQRPPLASGEVAVYHPETGSSVVFRTDGSVEVSAVGNLEAAAGGDATLTAAGAVAVTAGGNASILAGGTLVATSTGNATVTAPAIALIGNVGITGHLDQDGANIGFRGSAPVAKPVINGTKTGGTAQNQLLAALHLMGIIDDQT